MHWMQGIGEQVRDRFSREMESRDRDGQRVWVFWSMSKQPFSKLGAHSNPKGKKADEKM